MAVELGYRRFEHAQGRAAWTPGLLAAPLLDRRVGAKIRARLGGRLRVAVTGGAPIAAEIARFFIGLGDVTNLSDNFPWGFWIGFDVMGGVALAAATAMEANKPWIIVRNSKKDYGISKMVEGKLSEGDVVLLVEDEALHAPLPQPPRTGCARRPAADHRDVDALGHGERLTALPVAAASCAMTRTALDWADALGLPEDDGVVRVSFVHYNTLEEIERLIEVLESVF